MSSHPIPGEQPRARDLILRTLPERRPASQWCGRHDRARTRSLLRAAWVCVDCVRETSHRG